MLGREPILAKDGTPLVDAHGRRSYVTSAGAGPSIGKHILLATCRPRTRTSARSCSSSTSASTIRSPS